MEVTHGHKRGRCAHLIIPAYSLSNAGAPYLFLVLVLHAESLLDVVASLQEGLPLGSLRQDAHEQPRQVDAGEQHRVGHQLRDGGREAHSVSVMSYRHARGIRSSLGDVCTHLIGILLASLSVCVGTLLNVCV